MFVYTAELDALMHRVGIFEDAVAARLASYERFMERIFDAGEKSGRHINLYLLSDHGMTNVNRSVDLWGFLSKKGHRIGRDYQAFFDSTMARMWCTDSIRDEAVAHLTETDSGRLVSDDELREYGCYFEGAEYGRWILLANPGVMIVPSFMGSQQIAAMHGYDPDDKFSIGCFLTNDDSSVAPTSLLGFKDYIIDRVAGARL